MCSERSGVQQLIRIELLLGVFVVNEFKCLTTYVWCMQSRSDMQLVISNLVETNNNYGWLGLLALLVLLAAGLIITLGVYCWYR